MEISIHNPNPHGLFDEKVHCELITNLGVELPQDYLDYLLQANGGTPEPNFYWVVPNDWGSGIEAMYGMQRDAAHCSLLRNLNWPGITLKPQMLAIGGDGCFGYILMSLAEKDFGSIHFCCTWTEGDHVFNGQGYWEIGDNFSDFLSRLEPNPEE